MRRAHQLSVDGDWLPTTRAPSAYLPAFFECGGSNGNDYYCDPPLDRKMAASLSSNQPTDPVKSPPLWAGIDHALADQAAWLPLVNASGVDLVSRRVGNYQFHPVWGFIADQVWLR